MRDARSLAATVVVASLFVSGCGPSEAERRAEEARRPPRPPRQIEAASAAATRQVEPATQQMGAQMQQAARALGKAGEQMAQAAKAKGADAAATMMQPGTTALSTSRFRCLGHRVEASADGRTVTLTGHVPSQTASAAAEKTARAAAPSAAVKNALVVG